MTQKPAWKILLFEETPNKELRHGLQKLGYAVQSRAFPDATIFNYAAQARPDLLITQVSLPMSQTLVDTSLALQTRFHFPVIYLAAQPAEGLLARNGIDSYLPIPPDVQELDARLKAALGLATAGRAPAQAHPGSVAAGHSEWLFKNAPTALLLEDFSSVRNEIRALKDQGVRDLRAYLTENPDEVERCYLGLRILDVNQAAVRLYRATSKENLLSNANRIFDPLAHTILLDELVALSEGRVEYSGEGMNADLEGNLLHVQVSWSAPADDPGKELHTFIVAVVDITEHRQKQDTLQLVNLVSAALRSAHNRTEVLTQVINQITRYLNFRSVALVLASRPENNFLIERASGEWLAGVGRSLSREGLLSGQGFSTSSVLTYPDIRRVKGFPLSDLARQDTVLVNLPLQAQQSTIGQLWIGSKTPFAQSDISLLTTLADIIANAIHRVTLYEDSQRYTEQVATVSAIGRALSITLDINGVYERLAQGVQQLLPDVDGIYISTYDSQTRSVSYVYGQQDGERLDLKDAFPASIDSPSAGSQAEVIRTRQPLIANDLQDRRRQAQTAILVGAQASRAQSGMYVPMLAKDEILGVLYVQSNSANRFTPADGELLALVANTGAISLQNARLFAVTQRRVQRLTALHALDVAMSSSLDLRITLNTLLDQLLVLLRLDAADILILEPASQTLEYASGRGFRTSTLSHARLSVGEGLVGSAVLENRVVYTSQITQTNDPRAAALHAEGIVAYSAAPLVVKGQIKGILEVFFRTPIELDEEWQEFLETLAGQVAVGIDNATLVNQLQRTNMELTLAYDTTLLGWARALYLRDRETESHTRRVTEYSVQLARAMGLGEAEVVHIRRGALLHDIGKLGIPDNILLKTGPLNEAEWKKMQLHPEYANEMLRDINFLGPARLVPYCHHERWDGSGYPRGLKGEEIPLSARIFAVADVWDSLLSDRPYRQAWPREKARDYIISHAGTYFDPQVVEVFIKVLT